MNNKVTWKIQSNNFVKNVVVHEMQLDTNLAKSLLSRRGVGAKRTRTAHGGAWKE